MSTGTFKFSYKSYFRVSENKPTKVVSVTKLDRVTINDIIKFTKVKYFLKKKKNWTPSQQKKKNKNSLIANPIVVLFYSGYEDVKPRQRLYD